MVLLSESLHDYTYQEAKERLRFPHTTEFFDAVIQNKKGTNTKFISTKSRSDGQHEIVIHANGTQEQPVPTATTPRTIIAATGSWSSPTILAARRQMQSWKILAMEPTAIRTPDSLQADPHITQNGSHLHATLYRLATTAPNYDSEPENVYASVASHLSNLVPAWKLSVDVDPIRQRLAIEVLEQRFNGARIPARSLSDGTLRFLTLAVLVEDPDFHGLVCIEEPENGIHPGKMQALVELLKEMAVDPTFKPDIDEGNPMRQVIIATHSPYFVQLLSQKDLLIALQPLTRGPSGKPTRTVECWPLSETWRCRDNNEWLGLASILA